MNRKSASLLLTAVLTGCMLTSCGKPQLEGQYDLCTVSGITIGTSIEFRKNGTVYISGDKGKFEVTGKDTITIKKTTDPSLSGKFKFKLTDKDDNHIYIEDISEAKQKIALDNKAFLLYSAVNSAMLDTSIATGQYYSGTYMISSDEKNNYSNDGNTPLDTKFVIDAAKVYLDDIDKLKFVVVIDNNTCIAAACSVSGSMAAGSYPTDGILDIKTRQTIYEFSEKDRVTVDLITNQYRKQFS